MKDGLISQMLGRGGKPTKAVEFDKKLLPWHPPKWDPPDAAAMQALVRGDANAEQQQRAIRYIIEVAANTYDMSYRSGYADSERDTSFAEGRRFVGNLIVKLLRVNLMAFKQEEHSHDNTTRKRR